jgi:hypothetical protein
MNADSLKTMLILAGLLHLAITSAGVVMTVVLDWRHSLAGLAALTRHIIWTHGAFVLMTIVAFGVVSIACARSLTSGEPLARAVCAFIASFWGVRLLIGFFLFDAKPFTTTVPLKLGYHGLNVVFLYFVVCYTAAAVG